MAKEEKLNDLERYRASLDFFLETCFMSVSNRTQPNNTKNIVKCSQISRQRARKSCLEGLMD